MKISVIITLKKDVLDPQELNYVIKYLEPETGSRNRAIGYVIPTTGKDALLSEEELIDAGVNIVIYANHLLRSAYPAMVKTAETILKNKGCHEADKLCLPVKEILTLIPGGK